MDTLERCTELLDKNHILYIHSRPRRSHVSAKQKHLYADAKPVIVGSGDFLAMFVLPADRVLDLERLAVSLGLKQVRTASMEEIRKLFPDIEAGSSAPFGELFHLPVYLDERLTRHKYITFHIGPNRDSIYMRVDDYVRLVRPRILRVAYPEQQPVEQKERRS